MGSRGDRRRRWRRWVVEEEIRVGGGEKIGGGERLGGGDGRRRRRWEKRGGECLGGGDG